MIPYISVIPQTYLPNLKRYDGSCSDLSITRKYVLNPFYERIIHFIPKNISPNVITFIGQLFIILSALVSMSYSPMIDERRIPNWVFALNAISIFLYQTFDNLDGKQARRTGTSSSLGELLDHGCDAISTTFGNFAWMVTCAQGATTSSAMTFLIAYAPFCLSCWEQFYAGGLHLGYLNGPTEGLLGFILTQVFAAIFGHQIYFKSMKENTPWLSVMVPNVFMEMEMWSFFNWIAALFTIYTCVLNLMTVYKLSKSVKEFGDHLTALFPFIALFTIFGVWMSVGNAYKIYPYLFISTFGIYFAYMCSTYTLQHILHVPRLSRIYPSLLIPLIALITVATPILHFITTERLALQIVFFAGFCILSNYVISVCSQISSFLGIGVLTIVQKERVQ